MLVSITNVNTFSNISIYNRNISYLKYHSYKLLLLLIFKCKLVAYSYKINIEEFFGIIP